MEIIFEILILQCTEISMALMDNRLYPITIGYVRATTSLLSVGYPDSGRAHELAVGCSGEKKCQSVEWCRLESTAK